MRKLIPSYDWVCFSCGKENSKGVAQCAFCDCSAYLEGVQIVANDKQKSSRSEEIASNRWGWIILFYVFGVPILFMLKAAAQLSLWMWLLFLSFGLVLAWLIEQLKQGRRDE